jgi:hypothetical protein
MQYLTQSIRLFRIISIPSKCYYFRPLDHMISMECSALDFRSQCTQQKLQPICAVLSFDPQLKKKSIKGRYQLNHFICIKNFNAETITSLKWRISNQTFGAIKNGQSRHHSVHKTKKNKIKTQHNMC